MTSLRSASAALSELIMQMIMILCPIKSTNGCGSYFHHLLLWVRSYRSLPILCPSSSHCQTLKSYFVVVVYLRVASSLDHLGASESNSPWGSSSPSFVLCTAFQSLPFIALPSAWPSTNQLSSRHRYRWRGVDPRTFCLCWIFRVDIWDTLSVWHRYAPVYLVYWRSSVCYMVASEPKLRASGALRGHCCKSQALDRFLSQPAQFTDGSDVSYHFKPPYWISKHTSSDSQGNRSAHDSTWSYICSFYTDDSMPKYLCTSTNLFPLFSRGSIVLTCCSFSCGSNQQ